MAESYFQNKDFVKAASYYEIGLQIYPTAPDQQNNAALLWAQLNCLEDAIFHLRAYLELRPDAPDAKAARDQLLLWEAKSGITDVPVAEPGSIAAQIAANPNGSGVPMHGIPEQASPERQADGWEAI